MIFYLTATGNSLYVTKQLCAKLDQQSASIPQEMKRDERRYADDVIGIVCPVFGHELPPLVKEFVRTSTFETDYFFLVGTYGCMHGDFPERAAAVLDQAGYPADYLNTIIMVDNGLPAFDMEEELRRDPEKRVDEHIDLLAEDIAARKQYVEPTTERDREIHREYMKFDDRLELLAESTLMRVTGACVACGTCVRVCPLGNIALARIDDGSLRAVHGQTRCMGCLACIHACKPKATQFFELAEKNPNARYLNPHVKLAEIIAANNQA